ncbi:hypothetical protein [Rhodococcus sp. MEB064]|uniref:hypothetical protein n=1 Tax=Rhodococcus sp. MEB064 TaxID=1587522 RepID=UPI0006976E61|nr:hypothetical protein [Rhodococcus sp. MEB064]
MTLPSGGYPPGSITNPSGTGLSAHSQKTQAQWKAEQTGGVKNSFEGNFWANMIGNMFGGFLNGITGFIGAFVQGAFGIVGGFLDLVGGILGVKNRTEEVAEQAGSVIGDVDELKVRVTALEGGGTRTVYSANATWTNPGKGTVGIGAFNGGEAGVNGAVVNPGRGGVDGSYSYREFNCADLPATVAITIGAGGASNGQDGGQTSFGTFVRPTSGAPGSILTPQGAVASSSAPGAGGDGGNNQVNGNNGYTGGSTALASGGLGGRTNAGYNGSAGASVPLESDIPCGGGGGGGGAYRGDIFTNAGHGGAGGAPGGGGGGGGANNTQNGQGIGLGAPGANGRMVIIHTGGSTT